jgi:site-specific recombinase XerD
LCFDQLKVVRQSGLMQTMSGVKDLDLRTQGDARTKTHAENCVGACPRECKCCKRDRALLAILLACGVRRHEAVELNFGHIQQREDHWAIVDLNGKAGHIRTIPMPISVKNVLDQWVEAENLTSGRLFCRVHKMGKPWGEQLIEKAIWHVVREYAVKAGVDKLAPMTCAGRVLGSATQPEANWSKIQFLLVHVSIQTTERYLGCKQRIQGAVNDKIGIEPPE